MTTKKKIVLLVVLSMFLLTQIASHQVLCLRHDGTKVFEYSVFNLKCDCYEKHQHNHRPSRLQKTDFNKGPVLLGVPDSCYDLLIDAFSFKLKKTDLKKWLVLLDVCDSCYDLLIDAFSFKSKIWKINHSIGVINESLRKGLLIKDCNELIPLVREALLSKFLLPPPLLMINLNSVILQC
jgi:hypothetical protein